MMKSDRVIIPYQKSWFERFRKEIRNNWALYLLVSIPVAYLIIFLSFSEYSNCFRQNESTSCDVFASVAFSESRFEMQIRYVLRLIPFEFSSASDISNV